MRETCEIASAKTEFDNSDVGKEEARLNKENGSVYVHIFSYRFALAIERKQPCDKVNDLH